MLLDDSVSIGAMNSDYIPIKFKSDGTPDAYSKAKLYTENGWATLNESIERVVCEIAGRMTDGDISAIPMLKSNGKSDVCKYCEFKAVCRNAYTGK